MSLLLLLKPETPSTITFTLAAEADFGAGYVDISADLLHGTTVSRGIQGGQPMDLVAGAGEWRFTLKNGAESSGGVLGYYSPFSTTKRTGWGIGVPVRLKATHGGYTRTVFTGTVGEIAVRPGRYLSRAVDVIARDAMRLLADSVIRDVALMTSATDTEALDAICDAVPAVSVLERNWDTSVDTFPVVFDKLKDGVSALQAVADVVLSGFSLFFATKDGGLRWVNRDTRFGSISRITLDETMRGLDVTSSADLTYNKIRVTVHPRRVSTATTDILFSAPAGTIIVPSGETVEIVGEYHDPDEPGKRVGGANVVTTLVAGTHYTATKGPEPTSEDISSSQTVTLEASASSFVYTLTNTHAHKAVYQLLTVVGDAVRDDTPVTYETYRAMPYGIKSLDVNLSLQGDISFAEGLGSAFLDTFSAAEARPASVEFVARTGLLLAQALDIEIGDDVTISEAATGLSAFTARVQGVELAFASGLLVCRLRLAPSWTESLKTLGDATLGTLGGPAVLAL